MDQQEKRKLEQSKPDHVYGADDSDTARKRRKVVGPTLPLSNAVDKQHTPDSVGEAESSDDDDIGPSLPPSGTMVSEVDYEKSSCCSLTEPSTEDNTDKDRSHRDEWMLQPPGSTGWASKVDPTKLKSRKFQTGRSAPNSQLGDIDSSWTETPEQKMKRLQDKVMGVSTITPGNDRTTRPSKVPQAFQEKVQRYNEKRKGNAAQDVSPHSKSWKKGDGDDPSSRPFDREKDMTISSKITNAQRREMIDRAADFGSRFSKGNYL